jgi:hypothetical protein
MVATDETAVSAGKQSIQRAAEAVSLELGMRAGAGARQAITRVIRAFPTADFRDPVGLVSDMVEALEDYPAIVVSAMADPKTGIVRSAKFLPRIAEMIDWCDRELAAIKGIVANAQSALWRMSEAERYAKAAADRAANRDEWNKREAMLSKMVRRLANRGKDMNALEAKARCDWEKAMCDKLADRPDLVEEFAAILESQPDLIDMATKEERRSPRNGWPTLSHELTKIYYAKRGMEAPSPLGNSLF